MTLTKVISQRHSFNFTIVYKTEMLWHVFLYIIIPWIRILPGAECRYPLHWHTLYRYPLADWAEERLCPGDRGGQHVSQRGGLLLCVQSGWSPCRHVIACPHGGAAGLFAIHHEGNTSLYIWQKEKQGVLDVGAQLVNRPWRKVK